VKRKQTTPAKPVKKLELDREVIADLEVADSDKDAIRGGGRGSGIST